jgi:hypothetical protein
MISTPDLLRALLVLCAVSMALLAAFYLRRRELTLREYIAWGLLIVLLPLLGPFLVLLYQPGKRAR